MPPVMVQFVSMSLVVVPASLLLGCCHTLLLGGLAEKHAYFWTDDLLATLVAPLATKDPRDIARFQSAPLLLEKPTSDSAHRPKAVIDHG